MSQEQVDIADMQCWVFRLAQKRWHKTARECLALFERYGVLSYIEELYGLLHVSGYQSALDDVEIMMRAQGATI